MPYGGGLATRVPREKFFYPCIDPEPLSTLGRVDLIFLAIAYHRGLLKLSRKMRKANAALYASFSMQGSAGAHAPAGLKLAFLPGIANPDGVSPKELEWI